MQKDPTSYWQATANASAITHNALQAQYQKRSHKSMAGNCLRIRYYTQCAAGSIPETIPQVNGRQLLAHPLLHTMRCRLNTRNDPTE